MRITCPNCTSHFELPTELLGKKGRALKCASCGHAWYQTAQVGELDLAAVMGDDYAAQRDNVQAAAARAVAGSAAATVAAGAVRAAAQRSRQAATGAQGQALGVPGGPSAPPLPPGAVSMMRRSQGGASAQGPQSWNANAQGGPHGAARVEAHRHALLWVGLRHGEHAAVGAAQRAQRLRARQREGRLQPKHAADGVRASVGGGCVPVFKGTLEL